MAEGEARGQEGHLCAVGPIPGQTHGVEAETEEEALEEAFPVVSEVGMVGDPDCEEQQRNE